ncbi:MAG: RnfABCDGE type electron transport complex subunit G [Rhodocyclaceae bacterium]|nr:RnfABCDGE type electron transport complex subunit G [Rhodocyclaceae bacterium]
MSAEHTAGATSLRSAGVMLAFALAFTMMMATTYRFTRPHIEAAREAEKMKLIDAVLPPGRYDNQLLDDVVELGPTPALGLRQGGRVYRARRGGADAALIVEATAPDGYGGRIELLVAVGADDRLAGVRATAHAETPGLGDYIDPRKDRNKKAPWIEQFRGRAAKPATVLALRKDGGELDYRVGATISARAVAGAVARALGWTLSHDTRLYAAPAGSRYQP